MEPSDAYLLGYRDCLVDIDKAGGVLLLRQAALLDEIFERIDRIEPLPHLATRPAVYDQAQDG